MNDDLDMKQIIGEATELPASWGPRPEAPDLIRSHGRRVVRRRRLTAALSVLGAAVIIVVLVAVTATRHSTAPRPVLSPSPAPSTSRVPLGQKVPAASVVSLQMFTDSSGVGVAQVIGECAGACQQFGSSERVGYFLVGSEDGGATWRIRGALPAAAPAISVPAGSGFQVTFARPDTGYLLVSGGERSAVYLTRDGGRTWKDIRAANWPVSMSISGGQLWVVTDPCHYTTDRVAPTSCASRLITYQAGARTPQAQQLVPVPSYPGPVSSAELEPGLLDRITASAAVFLEDQQAGGANHLLLTTDSGRTWRTPNNPCGQLVTNSFAITAGNRWLLDCELGGGGDEQGSVALYTSLDAGNSWTLTAAANRTQGNTLGTIGTQETGPLVVSGNGEFLWRAGYATGITVSTDGGVTWSGGSETTDGATSLVTAGSTSAWLANPGYGLWHTSDGTHWTLLP